MITLKYNFTKEGYQHKLLKKEGLIHLYERRAIRDDWMLTEPMEHWEVIVAKKRTGSSPNAGNYAYPSPSDWGTHGWTLMTRQGAEKKYNELINQI